MDLISERKLGFIWTLETLYPDRTRKDITVIKNILPDVSITYLMGTGYTGQSQLTDFYIGLYEDAYTPVVGDDMTSLLGATTEASDYTGGVRLDLTGILANGVFSNIASPAEFEFTADKTVRGGFIANSSVIGNVSGVLQSAVEFPTAQVLETGFILRVTAGNGLISA